MTWWTGTSVSVNNGQSIVNVTTGDDVQIAQEAGGLIIGNNPPVEIKRTYLDGSGNKRIELRQPWPYSNQTNQVAVAFPTDADLAEATRVLRAVGSDAVTFAEALSQVLSSTAPTLTIQTETSGPVTVVPYGRLNQQVQTLLNTFGDFGVPLYDTDTKNQARTLLGLQPQITAQPTLNLDFANNDYRVYEPFGLTRKTLTEVITTVRGTVASYNSPFGIAQAAVNTPRIEYNPETGLGLLCEETRTNLAIWSEQFDNAAWLKNRATVTSNQILAPDNNSTADKLIEDSTANNSHYINQYYSINGATQHSFSVYLKQAERRFVQLRISGNSFTDNVRATFDLLNGTVDQITASGLGSQPSARIEPLSEGWFRCIVSGICGDAAFVRSLIELKIDSTTLAYTGDGTSGVYIWGAQLETGTFPTSYIKTEGGQGIRLLDQYNISPATLGDFTLYCEVKLLTLSNNRFLWISQNNTTTNRITLSCTTTNNQLIVFYGVDSVFTNIQSTINFLNTNSYFKLAVRRVGLTVSLFANGQLIGSATSAANYSLGLNNIAIGREGSGGNPTGSLFRAIKKFSRGLPDQEIIDLTRL